MILFTQTKCIFCDYLKNNLSEWGFEFEVIDIDSNSDAKTFLKEKNHKTVPQLYIDDFHINDIDTLDITKEYIKNRIKLCHEGN